MLAILFHPQLVGNLADAAPLASVVALARKKRGADEAEFNAEAAPDVCLWKSSNFPVRV